jgi:predicted nucleotidyltransferase
LTENSSASIEHNNFLALRLEEANKFTKKVLEKYGSLIKSVVLFGSIARGDATPDSDVNIFLTIDDTGARRYQVRS